MKIEFKSTGDLGESPSPARVFRKWVLIGAVVGALLVGMAGMFVVGAIMVGGAIVGAAVGVVVGIVKAAIAAVRGG
jgi:hypothetical protein